MKNSKQLLIAYFIGFLLLISNIASAGQGDLGLSLKGGTLGAGIEGTIGILDNVNARLGFNYWSMESDITESNVEYELDIDLMSISLLLDWHPLNNGFRLSIGALYNGNEFDATGKPTGGNYAINDSTYTAAQIGTLSTSIDFEDFAPYIGIGYRNAVGKSKRWNFVMDLGAMYQGSSDVTVSATGAAGNAALQSDIEAERRQLESDLDDFSFYPVISFGVSYKF